MNKSGIVPMKYRVLVEPEVVEEKTAGGIIIPQEAKEKEQYAVMEGTVIAVGSNAFEDPRWLERPNVGDRILFNRYAGGMPVKGKDGVEYRLMNDEEIGAVLR